MILCCRGTNRPLGPPPVPTADPSLRLVAELQANLAEVLRQMPRHRTRVRHKGVRVMDTGRAGGTITAAGARAGRIEGGGVGARIGRVGPPTNNPARPETKGKNNTSRGEFSKIKMFEHKSQKKRAILLEL